MDLPVLWCRERIETILYAHRCSPQTSYLPVLWCRERIETGLFIFPQGASHDLPVLWCRERIETFIVPGAEPPVDISLYSGAGSGLKRMNTYSV